VLGVNARVKCNGALWQFSSLHRFPDNPILDIADFTVVSMIAIVCLRTSALFYHFREVAALLRST
jgi:hypothetical protein